MRSVLIASAALAVAAPVSAKLTAPNDSGVTFAHVHPSAAIEIAYFTDPSGVRLELTEGLDLY